MFQESGYNIVEVERLAKGYALLNAVEHEGKAKPGPVMSKLMAEKPEWRPYAREIAELVKKVVEEVNKLSLEEQRRLLKEEYEWLLQRRERKVVEEKTLPPLPQAEEGKVVTRFAPNPDFVLHLGNARPAILSYEYAKIYKGRMILRFEDTDPRIKQPLPEAYQLIRDDLSWLGIKWDEEYIQSLRMKIYYDIARQLLERGGGYIDTLPSSEFKEYRDKGMLAKYPPRTRSIEDNLELWDKMLEGFFGEGEAVLRVKTDPDHPDPSVRDWVAFRIIDTSKTPHPLVGDKYIVWPTYNFAAGVDDHLMGVTHILRAREHMQNTTKQSFLYKHMGWSYPVVLHFGRLKLEGFIMSKSELKKLVEAGIASGIDDPRFATLAGLRRRGILPETIRSIMIEVGVKQTDASISNANLAAANRSLVDKKAKRYMFVADPIKLVVDNLPWKERIIEAPFHPNVSELGSRSFRLKGPQLELLVSRSDIDILRVKRVVRLMEAFNIEIVDATSSIVKARYHSLSLEDARRHKAPIIQWVLPEEAVRVEVVKPMGLELKREEGFAEKAVGSASIGEIAQFVRYGFVRIDSRVEGDKAKIVAIYAHD
ncbi:MAG: glutamate--tRNA ligase [Pyrodictiaceae archaeon]